jgi:hypothetical protein
VEGQQQGNINMKTTIVCDDWRALRRNTLQGFAAITIQELRLSIKDIAIHEKNHRRWAQLPARPQIKDGKAVTDADGKVQYFPVMAFEGRAIADAFSNAVIAAILRSEPHAFEDSAERPVPRDEMADEIPF